MEFSTILSTFGTALLNKLRLVKFEIFAVVTINIIIYLNVKPCRPVGKYHVSEISATLTIKEKYTLKTPNIKAGGSSETVSGVTSHKMVILKKLLKYLCTDKVLMMRKDLMFC
jgi:hypothetical protein